MKIFATLYEDIRHLKDKKETGPSKLSQAKDGIITGKVLFSYLPICFPCPQYQKQSQKSFVKLTQPMRNDVMNMPGAWDKDKI